MRNLLLTLWIAIALISRKKNREPELIGKWKLFESFYSIGSGPLLYREIKKDETLNFYNDGTVIFSNDYICSGDTIAQNTLGEYFKDGNYILVENCGSNKVHINYGIENSYLVLRALCVESCGEKYVKID